MHWNCGKKSWTKRMQYPRAVALRLPPSPQNNNNNNNKTKNNNKNTHKNPTTTNKQQQTHTKTHRCLKTKVPTLGRSHAGVLCKKHNKGIPRSGPWLKWHKWRSTAGQVTNVMLFSVAVHRLIPLPSYPANPPVRVTVWTVVSLLAIPLSGFTSQSVSYPVL